MLMSTIKADQLKARKSKDTITASILTTLIGEASMPGKNDGNRESTDAEVQTVIKKFIKNINEFLDIPGAETETLKTEKEILERYMPKQLSESDLKGEIQKIVDALEDKSPRAMGIVMKELKDKFDGSYDGKLASSLVKDTLA